MAVIYLDKTTVENITEDIISKIIQRHKDTTRYDKLHKYYIGEHDILNSSKSDSSAPNNKIVSNMAKYITDTATGYFIGLPVVYSSQNTQLIEKLQDVYDYNDEQDTNAEVAKYCSIYGHCCEMLYVDEDAEVRFHRLRPQEIILIYETGHNSLIAAIRIITLTDIENKTTIKYEYWTANEVWHFNSNNDKIVLQTIEAHNWNDVPFIEYVNNEERIGDFEGVISIIDAYNRALSNSANMFQYNDEALLKIMKIGDITSGDIKEMKEQGAIILDDGGDIDWLLKVIDDTALENHKNRLNQDMHASSSVPNLSDAAFGGNMSGVAISYKLWNLEQICAMKERKFKKGLQRRVELISNIFFQTSIKKYDYRDVEMQFRRNKPQNILEIAQIIQTLSSDLSRESRLKLLPVVENIQDELNKLEAEKQGDIKSLGGYGALANALKSTADSEGGVTTE